MRTVASRHQPSTTHSSWPIILEKFRPTLQSCHTTPTLKLALCLLSFSSLLHLVLRWTQWTLDHHATILFCKDGEKCSVHMRVKANSLTGAHTESSTIGVHCLKVSLGIFRNIWKTKLSQQMVLNSVLQMTPCFTRCRRVGLSLQGHASDNQAPRLLQA